MACSPSIGDILALIQIVSDIYQKTVDAPAEIEAAIKDLKGMKAELESIKGKVGDDKYFIKKNGGEMLVMVTETFEPLKEDLQNLKHLIREYRKIPPFSGMKIVFALFKIPDVKNIQANFNNYRAIYSRAFEHAAAVADAHNAQELKVINSKLEAKNKQLAAEFAQLKKHQQEAVKIQQANNAKMDQVLKLLEKMAVSPTLDVSNRNRSKIEWENQLVESGLQREEAKKIIAPLIWTSQEVKQGAPEIQVTSSSDSKNETAQGIIRRIRSQSSMKKENGLKAPGKPPGRSRSVSQPRGKKDQNQAVAEPSTEKGKAPSPVKTNLKSPGPSPRSENKKPPSPEELTKKTEHIWILCVDRTNGFRSILAQTYLELLRMWTANTSHPLQWLFAKVSSAGLNIATPLTTSSSLTPPIPIYGTAGLLKPSASSALTALCAPADYFQSTTYPFEKPSLVSRISSRQSRGLTVWDFESFHYMLCFEPSVADDLKQLKTHLEANGTNVKSEITYLKGTEWFRSDKHTHEKEMAECVSNMRAAIKWWVGRELGWQRPGRAFQNGMARTLQIVIPRKAGAVLMERMGQGGNTEAAKGVVAGVKVMEGCSVMVTREGGQNLVSVTGSKERLKAAEGWIRGLS